MLYLALHFGMGDDVYMGVARMVGFVEQVGHQSGIEYPMQMTLGVADGARLYAFRYSSERKSRTLFHSKSMDAVNILVPPERRERLDAFSDDALAIVSEPFSDLPDLWRKIPESTLLTVDSGRFESRDFIPVSP